MIRRVCHSRGCIISQALVVPHEDPTLGPHLILEKRSKVPNAPTIAFVSHLDTVFPPELEKEQDFRFKELDDGIVSGPGCGGKCVTRSWLRGAYCCTTLVP